MVSGKIKLKPCVINSLVLKDLLKLSSLIVVPRCESPLQEFYCLYGGVYVLSLVARGDLMVAGRCDTNEVRSW